LSVSKANPTLTPAKSNVKNEKVPVEPQKKVTLARSGKLASGISAPTLSGSLVDNKRIAEKQLPNGRPATKQPIVTTTQVTSKMVLDFKFYIK